MRVPDKANATDAHAVNTAIRMFSPIEAPATIDVSHASSALTDATRAGASVLPPPTLIDSPPHALTTANPFFVGQVVAGKHRRAAGKRWLAEKGAYRAALVDVLRFDLVNHLAGLQHISIGKPATSRAVASCASASRSGALR